MEERTKCVSHLPGAGKEEQDRRPADRGTEWRDRSGAALQSCGGIELEEREEISRGIAAGRSVRRIARGLKRSPSTISREIDATAVRRPTVQTGPRGAPGAGAAP